MQDDKHLSLSLVLLRLAMTTFLLVWVFQKLLVPQGAAGVFKSFYAANLSPQIVLALGVAQLVIVLAFAAGVLKFWTYGAVLAMNLSSVLVAVPRMINPYMPPNALFVASLPVLAASLLLFLLRDRDRLLALGPKSGA